jgi:beta-glucosidase-like glycosyl hydrolase
MSADVDERTLREIYLPAFERVVKQARPWTVMCAYKKLASSRRPGSGTTAAARPRPDARAAYPGER